MRDDTSSQSTNSLNDEPRTTTTTMAGSGSRRSNPLAEEQQRTDEEGEGSTEVVDLTELEDDDASAKKARKPSSGLDPQAEPWKITVPSGNGTCTLTDRHSHPDVPASEYEKLFFNDTLRGSSTIQFDIGRFLFEFFTSILWPLSLPVILGKQGVTAAQNKWFFPSRKLPSRICINVMLLMLTWSPMVMSLVWGTDWAWSSVGLALSFPVFRFLVIAGKYASYTDAQYDEVVHGAGEASKLLLAVRWLDLTPATIEEELQDSEHISDCHLEDHRLVLVGGASISARRYLVELLNQTWGGSKYDGKLTLGLLMFALLLCSHSIWSYLEYSGGTYTNYKDIIVLVLIGLQLLQFSTSVVRFMVIGMLHYYRQLKSQYALLDAVSPFAVKHGVVIDDYMFGLCQEGNLETWEHLRRTTRNFGKRSADRIAFNTFATVIVIAFFVLLLLQAAFAQRQDWRLLTFIIVLFTAVSGLAVTTLIFAYQVNRCEEFVQTRLAQEEVMMSMLMTPTAERDNLLTKLRLYRDYVRRRVATHPVTVMYLPAQASLVSAFVGLLATGGLVFLQITTSDSRNGNSS